VSPLAVTNYGKDRVVCLVEEAPISRDWEPAVFLPCPAKVRQGSGVGGSLKIFKLLLGNERRYSMTIDTFKKIAS